MSRNQEDGHSFSETLAWSEVNDPWFSSEFRAHFLHAFLGSLISRKSRENASHPRIRALYDIGCTLEKGMIKLKSSSVFSYRIKFSSKTKKSTFPQHNFSRMNKLKVNWDLVQVSSTHMCINGYAKSSTILDLILDGDCQMEKDASKFSLVCLG